MSGMMYSDASIYDGMYDGVDGASLLDLGNNRIIQEVTDEHRVRFVETTFDARIMNDGLKVATAILTVVSAILCMILVYCCVYMGRAAEEDAEL